MAVENLGPLDWRIPIVTPDGRPTAEFQRRWEIQIGNDGEINGPANPTAIGKDTAVNGVATTYMRSDAAPAIQKASSSQFGLVKVDGTTITETGGIITASGAGGWTLTSTTTISSPVPNVDFTGLTGSEIMITTRNVTKSVSSILALAVSVNNGSSYYTTVGDYVFINANGVETNDGFMLGFHNTNATAARSGVAFIHGANNNGGTKFGWGVQSGTATGRYFLASTSPINAIRIIGHLGGNLTGGVIAVWQR